MKIRINEIRISTVQNCLPTLLRLQSEIKTSRDPKDQRLAAVRCAELVLPIWEEKYPNDKRVRTCIEVTKKFLAGEASKEQLQTARTAAYAANAAYAAYAVAAAAYAANAAYAAYAAASAASYAAAYAIQAVKEYFNLKENLNEAKLPTPQRKQLLKEFIKFCIQELGLKSPLNCKITLTNDKKKTTSYAHFNPGDNSIVVYVKDRNIGDIMRSLSHEIFHMSSNKKQSLDTKSGLTGSKEENNANTFAGVIMRKFGKLHPEIYE